MNNQYINVWEHCYFREINYYKLTNMNTGGS